MKLNGKACPPYLFIAYVTSQFPDAEDIPKLHAIAIQATKNAGLQCYWIGQNCLPDDDEDYVRKSLDVSPPKDVLYDQ